MLFLLIAAAIVAGAVYCLVSCYRADQREERRRAMLSEDQRWREYADEQW